MHKILQITWKWLWTLQSQSCLSLKVHSTLLYDWPFPIYLLFFIFPSSDVTNIHVITTFIVLMTQWSRATCSKLHWVLPNTPPVKFKSNLLNGFFALCVMHWTDRWMDNKSSRQSDVHPSPSLFKPYVTDQSSRNMVHPYLSTKLSVSAKVLHDFWENEHWMGDHGWLTHVARQELCSHGRAELTSTTVLDIPYNQKLLMPNIKLLHLTAKIFIAKHTLQILD